MPSICESRAVTFAVREEDSVTQFHGVVCEIRHRPDAEWSRGLPLDLLSVAVRDAYPVLCARYGAANVRLVSVVQFSRARALNAHERAKFLQDA